MSNPEAGPFGDTLRERKVRAIVAASFVNKPAGGWVESVFTFDTQRFEARLEPRAVLPDLPLTILTSDLAALLSCELKEPSPRLAIPERV
jgi:hypothetical protein